MKNETYYAFPAERGMPLRYCTNDTIYYYSTRATGWLDNNVIDVTNTVRRWNSYGMYEIDVKWLKLRGIDSFTKKSIKKEESFDSP